jgi:DNA-directed RNA polymerase subunit beta
MPCYAHSSHQWVDDATNKMVNDLIHNYKIKLNDLQVHLRRETVMNARTWN